MRNSNYKQIKDQNKRQRLENRNRSFVKETKTWGDGMKRKMC